MDMSTIPFNRVNTIFIRLNYSYWESSMCLNIKIRNFS